jgi:hypothetical protein
LVCQYPGCNTDGPVERCSNTDGRLVCAAHRIFRNGAYVCAMCEDERRANETAAQAQATAAVYREHAESRQRWLFWGNIFSAVWGVALIAGGFADFNDPTYAYYHGGTSGASAGLSVVIFGVILALAAAWALRDAGGFKRRVYEGKTTIRKVAYWLAAAFGLVFGVGLVIAIVLGIAVFFGVAGAEGQKAEARAVVRDGVTDAIRNDRGHY